MVNRFVEFIREIIFIALLLGAAGELVDATRFMSKKAITQHRMGLVSSKWWTSQLLSGGQVRP